MKTLFKHNKEVQKDFNKIYSYLDNLQKKLMDYQKENEKLNEEIKILKRKIK